MRIGKLMTIPPLAVYLGLASAMFAGAAAAQSSDVDCTNAQSTAEINECMAEELSKADAELNEVYKQAMGSQVQLDKDLAEANEALVGAAKALKGAQRAWIAFRDINCESKSYINAGGTIRTAEELTCQKEMTIARTKELKELIGGDN